MTEDTKNEGQVMPQKVEVKVDEEALKKSIADSSPSAGKETPQAEEKVEEKEKIVITDEIRDNALKKPTFKIMYVGDDDSHLAPFRGSTILRTFVSFYEQQANIEYYTMSSNKLGKITLKDLEDVNILWIDNISDFRSAKNLTDVQQEIMDQIDPNWKTNMQTMSTDAPEKIQEYAKKLNKKRSDILRVVYCIDEFVWEGTVGRSRDVGTVQLIETIMNISDAIIVPTHELKESIEYFKFTQDPDKEIYVIPSSVNTDFFPLFKNFKRTGKTQMTSQLRDKPKILIKGLAVPKNVEQFIVENHKKYQLTLCSVDDVNDHIKGMIQRGKIGHIYHWANPYVNRRNIMPTYAIERDGDYDFVIHTKPDDLRGDMFELTTGDEDVLFSIACGSLPISGVNHLGMEEDAKHLGLSGLTFGKDTPSKKIAAMIEKYQTPVLFNEKFGKCRQMVENRISTSPYIIARYFNVMLGKELAHLRALIASEKREELEKEEQAKLDKKIEARATSTDAPANVIEADFNKAK